MPIIQMKSSNICTLYLISRRVNLKVSKLNGMKVISANAVTLGEVDGAHANTSTWKITNLEIRLTKETVKELGFKKPMLGSVSVCLPVSEVKSVGDVITLKHTLKTFKNLKECKLE
jgi:sporulation protein YlmC with PRC-barrel domain